MHRNASSKCSHVFHQNTYYFPSIWTYTCTISRISCQKNEKIISLCVYPCVYRWKKTSTKKMREEILLVLLVQKSCTCWGWSFFSHYFPKVFYFIIPSLKLNWWISFWGKRPIFHGEHLSFRKRTSQVIPGVLRNGSWKLVASSIAILTSLLATRVPIFDGDSSFGAKADLVVVVFSRWNFHLKSHYGSMGMVYL